MAQISCLIPTLMSCMLLFSCGGDKVGTEECKSFCDIARSCETQGMWSVGMLEDCYQGCADGSVNVSEEYLVCLEYTACEDFRLCLSQVDEGLLDENDTAE